MNDKNRSDKATLEIRIMKVTDLILDGLRSVEICRFVSSNYAVDERTAERYMKEARERIAGQNIETLGNNIDYHVGARLQSIRRISQNINKLHNSTDISFTDKLKLTSMLERDAHIVRADLAKIQGLYIERIDLNQKIEADYKIEIISTGIEPITSEAQLSKFIQEHDATIPDDDSRI